MAAIACSRSDLLLADSLGGVSGDGDPDAASDGMGPEGSIGGDGGSDEAEADAPCPGDIDAGNQPQIATGESHACIRNRAGEVYCWGANDIGQLGDGTTQDRGHAQRVDGLPKVTHVALGTDHTCILGEDQSVWCWGGNTQGELGLGVRDTSRLVPTLVTVPAPPISIVAGGHHTCTLDAEGNVACWGRNTSNECGLQGTSGYVTTPGPVPGSTGAHSIVAGWEHTCGIYQGGSVKCWGRNRDGQIGNGHSGYEPAPVAVVGLSDAFALLAGDDHTCAIQRCGTMWCWGDGPHGELGWNVAESSLVPVPVSGMANAMQGGGGLEHSCIATVDGLVYCWGKGLQGELGVGTQQLLSMVPILVGDVHDAVAVAAGQDFSCEVDKNEHASCWGINNRGQLGDDHGGDGGLSTRPTQVLGLP